METNCFIAMITVVTGLPRSGTSLAMQLLEGAGILPFTDGQRLADASNPQGYYEAEIVKTLPQDSTWLAQAEGRAVKVIHLLLPHLPDNRYYRVLVMGREIDAVLRERLGQAGAALPEARLQGVMQAQLAQMEAWLAARPRLPVLRLGFETCLADPLNSSGQLLRWLELAHQLTDQQQLARVLKQRSPQGPSGD
jgi:LPS sulfotransferase NodH